LYVVILERAIGNVDFKVYLTYILANGHFCFWFMGIILFITARLSQVAENWWLKVWSNASNNDTSVINYISIIFYEPSFDIISNQDSHDTNYYFNIYVLISMLTILLGISKYAWLYYGSLRASRKLYEALLYRIIRAPLRFFDTTPVGRILNRFSRDFETIDSTLAG